MPAVKKSSPTPSKPAGRGMGRDEAVKAKIRATKPGNVKYSDIEASDPNKPLTDMQRAFAKLWGQGETISNAARKAGYATDVVGYRLARMPAILIVYQDEKRKFEAAAQMDRKKVMDGLMEAIDLARMCEEPSTMVSGWREIAKMCGYYEPVQVRHIVSQDGKDAEKRLNEMSDVELLKLVEERAAAARQIALNAPKEGVTDVAYREGGS